MIIIAAVFSARDKRETIQLIICSNYSDTLSLTGDIVGSVTKGCPPCNTSCTSMSLNSLATWPDRQ